MSAIVGLVVFIFFLLLYLPFGIGERKDRNKQVGYIDKLIGVSKEIEKVVDMSDLDGSKQTLKELRTKLNNDFEKIDETLSSQLATYNHIAGFPDSDVESGDSSIKDLLKSEINYKDNLKRYIERIDFVLNENTIDAYSELDKISTDWLRYLEEDRKEAKKRESFAQGIAGSLTAIFATLNSIFGVPLSDLLTKLRLLE